MLPQSGAKFAPNNNVDLESIPVVIDVETPLSSQLFHLPKLRVRSKHRYE